jgi:putative DNA primase/helicase
LVSFTVTIAPEKRDLQLPEKLKAEWPQILAWAVAGCAQWPEWGLAPPAVVVKATKDYLTAEDRFQTWVDDFCLVGPDEFGLSSDLWDNWCLWTADAKERTGTRKAFGQKLEAHGFKATREGGQPSTAICTIILCILLKQACSATY